MDIRGFQVYVWYATCVGIVFADTQTIPAEVGSTAILPCHLSDVSSQPLHIIWRIKREIVFERKGKESYVGEGYEGRVEVPEDGLRNGNCSLRLNDVRSTDAAVYQSFLGMKRTKRAPSGVLHFIQSIELSVNAKPENTNEDNQKSTLNNAVGMNYPHPLLIALSFIPYLLFLCKETLNSI
ncbi:uncharacterized protein Hap1MRO34_002877 isoform 1-T3 [Clarias gariepinus]